MTRPILRTSREPGRTPLSCRLHMNGSPARITGPGSRNRSEQFEARTLMIEVPGSPSIRRDGWVPYAYRGGAWGGKGRAPRSGPPERRPVPDRVALCGEQWPARRALSGQPNGSPQGITGLSRAAGRVTIMLPHPERVFRAIHHSRCPNHWGQDGPWRRLFRNARVWVD